ncbi:putative disease resistance protein RGA1 [Cucurbita moschata]|uniref:Disease resistance protein RGA1 n=1 Tax=Cucurbita moschata TaxID=3662 RepID=A0A6J1EUW9_CUCMO|nr:putative disease resistance protein RGA1 [Cucurbita moschata]XP_022931675.1 putative disease resistance protein RGA1 [Cucurbita moschata]
MAESILFHVAASLATKLGSPAITEFQLFWGVHDELDKLKHTILTMEAVLLDAEEQQSNSHAVKNWISRVKDAFYEVDDLIDEFTYETLRHQVMAKGKRGVKEVRQVFSLPHQIAFRFKISHKIRDVREKLKAIDADKNQFYFSERVINTRDDELRKSRETISFICDDEVVGRNPDKKAIIDLLLNTDLDTKENIGVIAIVGMGGLGKTALAQSVYNNENITKHFDLKLWVCVSEDFDIKVIVEKIIESATRKKPEILQMDSLQSDLRTHINGKKYLLIMDDVWNEDYEKWVNLKRLLMGGTSGSRILITTRHRRVAETFDTTSCYDLGELDDKSAWLLFKKMALGSEEPGKELENSNLVDIGKEIVVKLKGLPLAIRTIGRLLYAKKPEHHLWLTFKDKELSRVLEQREETQFILSILELSYHHLPSSLKQCFLYCTLFPKDYNIRKDEVIKQWVAQGFVQSVGVIKPYDIGEDYFMELLSRSFFQDVTRNEMGDIIKFKIHDLMNDLACSIVKKEYVSMDVNDKVVTGRTRHISIYHNFGIKLENLKLLYEAKNLRTLIIDAPTKDAQKVLNLIPTKFLRLRTLSFDSSIFSTFQVLPKSIGKLKHLRYLNICLYELQFLPNSITKLYNLETLILDRCEHLQELPRDAKNWMKLRYLSLTGNTEIKFLPDSIASLLNLETLILQDCSLLRELPKDIKKCVNLKHLDLRGCNALTHLPKGLGELTNLQTMNLFILNKDVGCDLSELNRLSKLRGSLTIKGLEVCTTEDLKNSYFNLRLKLGFQELKFVWNYSKDEHMNIVLDNECKGVLNCLQPHSNVGKIDICGYPEVMLCDWLSSNTLLHLVSIKLSDCFQLQVLPQFDQFPCLKCLGLKSLPCIEYIDNDGYRSSSIFFPSLEKLSIIDMHNLKGWWKGETSSEGSPNNASFPITMSCLCELKIDDCPQLASIPWHAPLKLLEICAVSLQLLNVIIEKTANPSSKLSHVYLSKIDDIEFLPREFYHFTNLLFLVIEDCKNLQLSSALVQHSTNDVLWKEFQSLHVLFLRAIPKLEYLPNGMQHVTTLQHIGINSCPNFVTLPKWIHNLTSLSSLSIFNCPKLTSLPEGIHHLRSLESLTIWNSPKLIERYKKGKGEEWQKISHIPHINLS